MTDLPAVGPNIKIAKPRKMKRGDKNMEKLFGAVDAGLCFVNRKEDGACAIGFAHSGTADFFSRNQSVVTGEQILYSQKMGGAHKDLVRLGLPGGTVIVGEAVSRSRNGRDHPHRLAGILNSLAPRAVELQVQHGLVRFIIFDVLAVEGEWVVHWPKWRRMGWLIKHFGKKIRRLPLITISRNYRLPLDQVLGLASRKKWEGVVIWFREAPTSVRAAGERTPRPEGIYALKFRSPHDFAVIGWDVGKKGKKALRLARAVDGVLVPSGKVSNLSAKALGILEAQQMPFVVEVLAEAISSNGVPQKPALKLDKETKEPIIRHDKNPEECEISVEGEA